MRFLGAVEGLTKERCELLARRWRLDAEASRGLLKVVARSRYLKAEEAAALLALRTVPTYLQGDAGWAVQLVGRYHDTLHHNDGTWRFHRRAAEFVPPHPG